MIAIGDQVRSEFVTHNIDTTLQCLIEKYNPDTGEFSGWSENYILLNQDNFKPDTPIQGKNTILTGVLTDSQGNQIENEESII